MKFGPFITLFAFALGVSAALAQSDEPPMVFVPEFAAQPSSSDYIRNYPPRALRENRSGIAVLCCTPGPDQTINCATNMEWPDASVRAARGYRLSPQSHADLVARPGTQVRLSVRWASPVPDETAIAHIRSLDRETAYVCLPSQPE